MLSGDTVFAQHEGIAHLKSGSDMTLPFAELPERSTRQKERRAPTPPGHRPRLPGPFLIGATVP